MRACVCVCVRVYRLFRIRGMELAAFFLLDSGAERYDVGDVERLRRRGIGRLSATKGKREEKLAAPRASDKTKYPGGCLRAAPLIRNVGGRVG